MITVQRGRNRNYRLMQNETEVGEVWKLKGSSGFGLKLHGIYWRKGEPNTRSGLTATQVPRLKDAVPFAEQTLSQLGH